MYKDLIYHVLNWTFKIPEIGDPVRKSPEQTPRSAEHEQKQNPKLLHDEAAVMTDFRSPSARKMVSPMLGRIAMHLLDFIKDLHDADEKSDEVLMALKRDFFVLVSCLVQRCTREGASTAVTAMGEIGDHIRKSDPSLIVYMVFRARGRSFMLNPRYRDLSRKEFSDMSAMEHARFEEGLDPQWGMGIDLSVEQTLAENDEKFMRDHRREKEVVDIVVGPGSCRVDDEEDVLDDWPLVGGTCSEDSTALAPSTVPSADHDPALEKSSSSHAPAKPRTTSADHSSSSLFSDWVIELLKAVYTQYHYPEGTDACNLKYLLMGAGLDSIKSGVPHIDHVSTVRTLGYLGCLLQHEKYLQRSQALERLLDFLLAKIERCEAEVQRSSTTAEHSTMTTGDVEEPSTSGHAATSVVEPDGTSSVQKKIGGPKSGRIQTAPKQVRTKDLHKVQWNAITSLGHLFSHNPKIFVTNPCNASSEREPRFSPAEKVIGALSEVLKSTTHEKVRAIAVKAIVKV